MLQQVGAVTNVRSHGLLRNQQYMEFSDGRAMKRLHDEIKDMLYHMPMPEYDIGDGGIIVHCRANSKYRQLSVENRLGLSETILRRLGVGDGLWRWFPHRLCERRL